MKTIKASDYSIYFEDNNYEFLTDFLEKNTFSTLFILVDEHTKNKCLPIFLSKINAKFDFTIISIPAGEDYKNLKTCQSVWQTLTEKKADRKSILLNIGGGMVTDLGGFVAATFKRGIRFINVSTSLLGMVDASVGGKTGVDFNGLKNQIGVFANPELVLIDSTYLKTLPKRELISGMAEVIKYGLSYEATLWNTIKKQKSFSEKFLREWIYQSIKIKNDIVLKDPKENGLRKILNYGHTIGHAIETHFLQDTTKETLTHGEAIAVGLICETYLSNKLFSYPDKEVSELKKYIVAVFGKIDFKASDFKAILNFMQHDKKNINGTIQFVLLENIATSKIDCIVSETVIIESLNYYLS